MTAASTLPRRGVFLTRVLENVSICREHYRFVLEVEDFPASAPGQFVQIMCANPSPDGWHGGTFIRRPFSIGGLRQRGHRCEIDILHRAVGTGTRWLANLKRGDSVNILGPLGRPFQVDTFPTAYLIGGGIGLPPLIWLAEALQQAGKNVLAFCGSRSADLLPLTRVDGVAVSGTEGSPALREFAQYQTPAVVATDDGTLGAHGRIPDVFEAYVKNHLRDSGSAAVYTCGPEAMMYAIAKICQVHDIPCHVCLERVMACGMGTCQSCVVPVHDTNAEDGWRYRLCCTDGPVFDSREVVWS